MASVTGSEAFDLAVNAKSVPYASECSVQEVTLCVRYKVPHEESNMALVEIEMISGYVPTKASLHTLLELPSSSKFITYLQTIIILYGPNYFAHIYSYLHIYM